MDFEWDPAKAKGNLTKHGIDFVDAAKVFAGPHVVYQSNRDGEARFVALGYVQNRLLAVVYTTRRTVTRLISARRAQKREEKRFNQAFDA